MMLVSFFDVSNQKSVNSKKPITYLGMKVNEKVSFMEIADFWLEKSKSDTNII